MNVPVKPPGAEVLARVDQALAGLAADNLIWLSGYLYGLARQPAGPAQATSSPSTATRIRILYGSQTGNARRLAEAALAELQNAGRSAQLQSLAELRPRDLRGIEQALFVVSTQGDGEPPEDCRDFYEALAADSAPRLEALRYSVIALGDSSYPQFCASGRILDERLQALGAQRLQDRFEGDLDYQRSAPAWLQQWRERLPAITDDEVSALPGRQLEASVALQAPSPAAPLSVELIANLPLTAPGALRDVRHLELAFEPGQLNYRPGDALGLRFANPAQLVEPVLAALGRSAELPLQLDGAGVTLAEALRERIELSRLSRPVLLRYAQATGAAELQALLQPDHREALQHYLRNHQLVDLLRRYPDALDPQALLDVLPPLQHRLYSIASSPATHADEVHLTVALRADERAQGIAYGACSTALAALQPGSRIGAWVEPNPRFRLPEDDQRDVIMIGPGTGVAPFRGFLSERIARGATGRNWLVFGSRRRYFDFLYQTEWLQALARGQLQRLSLAFSRDGAGRVYVQDRLRAEARELYRWIDGGAHIYLCGDAFAMAPAVEAALVDVIAGEAGIDAEAAGARLAQLRREGRFALDVY